jgi:hypothetical protein
MLETIKIEDGLYEVRDESRSLFVKSFDGLWSVINRETKKFVAHDLDTFDEAEGTAFEWLSKVSA